MIMKDKYIKEMEEELSDCCGAEVKHTTICSSCEEHCEAVTGYDLESTDKIHVPEWFPKNPLNNLNFMSIRKEDKS